MPSSFLVLPPLRIGQKSTWITPRSTQSLLVLSDSVSVSKPPKWQVAFGFYLNFFVVSYSCQGWWKELSSIQKTSNSNAITTILNIVNLEQMVYKHFSELCPKKVCMNSECRFRHPKSCKFAGKYKIFQRNICAFMHVKDKEPLKKYWKTWKTNFGNYQNSG